MVRAWRHGIIGFAAVLLLLSTNTFVCACLVLRTACRCLPCVRPLLAVSSTVLVCLSPSAFTRLAPPCHTVGDTCGCCLNACAGTGCEPVLPGALSYQFGNKLYFVGASHARSAPESPVLVRLVANRAGGGLCAPKVQHRASSIVSRASAVPPPC